VDEEEIKQFNERNKKEINNNQNVDVIMDDWIRNNYNHDN
jgi:hypothetical protein